MIFEGGSVSLTIAERISGGNWAPPPADAANFMLELLLLDTPIGSGVGLSVPQLPRVQMIGCDNG